MAQAGADGARASEDEMRAHTSHSPDAVDNEAADDSAELHWSGVEELFAAHPLTKADAETSLFSELAGDVSAERLADIVAALRPTYASLPKGPSGQNLGHQAVRYVLHRLFVQRHSWYVRGLEPGDEDKPLYLDGGEWVPAYLQSLLEGERGMNLDEVAALAATIEDLVHQEAIKHLGQVYGMHGFSPDTDTSITASEAHELVSTYMMVFLKDGNFASMNAERVHSSKASFKAIYR
jgi:hypothetical protein